LNGHGRKSCCFVCVPELGNGVFAIGPFDFHVCALLLGHCESGDSSFGVKANLDTRPTLVHLGRGEGDVREESDDNTARGVRWVSGEVKAPS
jgi:hypothetical protein